MCVQTGTAAGRTERRTRVQHGDDGRSGETVQLRAERIVPVSAAGPVLRRRQPLQAGRQHVRRRRPAITKIDARARPTQAVAALPRRLALIEPSCTLSPDCNHRWLYVWNSSLM